MNSRSHMVMSKLMLSVWLSISLSLPSVFFILYFRVSLKTKINRTRSADLGVAEVHLGVLGLELLEDVGLALVVGGGQAELLLALVVHHLLDHAAGLAVEVGQLAVLGLDLGDVDLGGGGDDVRPPLHLVRLVEVDLDRLGAVGRRRQRPGGLFGVDRVGEVALHEGEEG